MIYYQGTPLFGDGKRATGPLLFKGESFSVIDQNLHHPNPKDPYDVHIEEPIWVNSGSLTRIDPT